MAFCMQFVRGTVITLEKPGADPLTSYGGSSGVLLHELEESLYFEQPNLLLRKYIVPPGQETQYVSELSRRSGVLAASLDYTGETAASSDTLSHPFASSAKAKYCWNDGAEYSLFKDGKCIDIPRENLREHQSILAVIDHGKQHSSEVVKYARQGYDSIDLVSGGSGRRNEPSILCLYFDERDESVSLWRVTTLLMALCQASFRIAAVNMSIDLGASCSSSNLSLPHLRFTLTFSLFEEVLDCFRSSRLELKQDAPLIFAAAGNRTNGGSWRLAYPATLPDVVAVSCVEEDSTGRISPPATVDLPAVGPLKPCFAVSGTNKTSFASGHLAGQWLAFDAMIFDGNSSQSKNQVGPFAKIALLASVFENTAIVGFLRSRGEHLWLPSFLKTSTRGLPQPLEGRNTDPFTQLLRRLSSLLPKHEFMLTGSAAYVSQWLSTQGLGISDIDNPDDISRTLGLVSDLDFLYLGEQLNQEEMQLLSDSVRDFFSERDVPFSIEAIQVFQVRKWALGLSLLQCVIADAAWILTTEGPFNPLLSRLSRNENRLFVPPVEVWWQNPQYSAGIAGMATGILIWINLRIIEAGLCDIYSIQRPIFNPPEWFSTEHRRIIGLREAMNDPLIQLFGSRVNSAKNSFVPRCERFRELSSNGDLAIGNDFLDAATRDFTLLEDRWGMHIK